MKKREEKWSQFFRNREKIEVVDYWRSHTNFVQFEKIWYHFYSLNSLITSGLFIFIYFCYLWAFLHKRDMFVSNIFFIFLRFIEGRGGRLLSSYPVRKYESDPNFYDMRALAISFFEHYYVSGSFTTLGGCPAMYLSKIINTTSMVFV